MSTETASIIGGVTGFVVVGGAIAGGLLFSQRRYMKNVFDNSIWAQAAVTNPLYKDRTMRFENPLYRDPKADPDDDDDDSA